MLGQRHEIARLQGDFYRDQFRKIIRWLVVSLVVMYVFILLNLYVVLFQPRVPYYANTIDGQILDMPKPKQ